MRHGPFCNRCISFRKIETLLEATHDFAQNALTLFPFGCARIETGNLPVGGYAMVGIWNSVTCEAPAHCGAARNLASTKASSSVLVLGDLSVMAFHCALDEQFIA